MQTKQPALDEQLNQLALLAQHHPPMTLERQKALTKLVGLILRSGLLCRPQQGYFWGLYEDIYAEACQNLFLYLCQHIDKYDVKRGNILTWCNVLLQRRFFKEAIPIVLDRPGLERKTLSDLDGLFIPEESPTLTELLRECIEVDPDNCFKHEHVRNYPEVTFQALALRRLGGKRWREIADEFGISIPTLAGFYRQNLTKFADLLKQYCSESGT